MVVTWWIVAFLCSDSWLNIYFHIQLVVVMNSKSKGLKSDFYYGSCEEVLGIRKSLIMLQFCLT